MTSSEGVLTKASLSEDQLQYAPDSLYCGLEMTAASRRPASSSLTYPCSHFLALCEDTDSKLSLVLTQFGHGAAVVTTGPCWHSRLPCRLAPALIAVGADCCTYCGEAE